MSIKKYVMTLLENSEKVKSRIGDSTNNHRVLTVNQALRYAKRTNFSGFKRFQQLVRKTAPTMLSWRKFANSRTDAYDVNEFLFYI